MAISLNRQLHVLLILCIAISLGCPRQQELPSEIPGIIVGSSMAPTLLGEHWEIHCSDCQFPIRFDFPVSPRTSETVVCPNCGNQHLFQKQQPKKPAETVTIQPSPNINRWDIVAFRIPGGTSVGIKRVVGLPGESLNIRQGNIFVGDQLQQKNWNQQRELRMLVHDTHYSASSNLPPRWQIVDNPPDAMGGWHIQSNQWLFREVSINPQHANDSPLLQGPPWHWLSYRHWRGCRNLADRTSLFPIEDLDSFNQGLSRELNPTADLMLVVDGQFSLDSVLGIRFSRGRSELLIEIDFSNRRGMIWETPDATVILATNPSHPQPEPPHSHSFHWASKLDPIQKIEASTFDDQIGIAFNEVPIFQENIASITGELAADKLIQFGAVRGEVDLHRMRVYRDIYYLPQLESEPQLTADRDHFLLIGDNVSTSTDSRHWRNGGIGRKYILGKIQGLQKELPQPKN